MTINKGLSSPKKIFITSLTITIIVLIGFGLYLRDRDTLGTTPIISVSIRNQEVRADCITLTWVVKNRSEQVVTFDENHIMQIKLNGQDVQYPTEARTLKPGEDICIDVELVDIDTKKSNEVVITADTNEGTTATMRQTIDPS